MSVASIHIPLWKSDIPISWPTPLRSRAKSAAAIAHARALRGRRPLGLAERGHDPRPGPEGRVVEGGALALGPLGAVAGEAGIDETRVHASEGRVVHAEHGELSAPEVGQEHV